MQGNDAHDNNTILGVSLLSNGNVRSNFKYLDQRVKIDKGISWLSYGICTCSSKANRHFIIYKVAKKVLMYKNLPPQVFWQPMAK